MSKKHIVRNVLIGIAAVIVCLAIAVAITINTPWFRGFIKGEISKLALQDAGAHLQIGSISTHWTRFVFDLNNLTVNGNQQPSVNAPPLLQVARLEVGLRFWPLLDQRVELTKLILDKPVVHLRIDARGRSNLPVSPHPSKSSGSATDELFSLKIADCAIDSGQIFYNDAEVPFDAQLHDVTLKTGYNLLTSEYKGSLSYDRGVLAAKQLGAIDNAMQVQFTANRSGLSLDTLVFTTPASHLRLAARITNYASPHVDGKYAGDISTEELANALHSPSIPAGIVALNGTLAYQAGTGKPFIAALNTQGHMQSDRLEFQRGQTALATTGVSADYFLQNATLRVPNLIADVLGGKARANFEMQHTDAKHAASRLEASLQGVSLAVASHEFASGNVKKIPIAGTTDLRLRAAWSGAISDAVASAHIKITSGQNVSGHSIPVNGIVSVDYNGRQDKLSFGQSYLRTANTHLSIAGTLSSRKGGQSTLTLLATTSDLGETAEVASMLENAIQPSSRPSRIPSLGGSASLTIRATGTAKNPEILGRLAAQNLAFAGTHWQSLALSLSGNSSEVEIQNGILTTGGKPQISFSASAGLNNWKITPNSPIEARASIANMQLATVQEIGQLRYPITGTLSADVSITGTRSALNGKATLTVSNASAWNEAINKLTVNADSHAGAIQSKVNLEIPAGSVSLNANYDISTQQYDLNLQGSGLKLEQIQALQTRALIQGTANIQANGNGTIHNPELELKLSVPRLQAEGQTISNAVAQVHVANQHAALSFQCAVDKGSVGAKGDVALTGERYTTATVDVHALPIGAIAANFAPSQASRLGGETGIHLAVSGPLKSPWQMQAQLQVPTLTLTYGTAQIALTRPLLANYSNGTLTVMPSQIKGPGTSLTFGGTIPIKSNAAYALVADGSLDLGTIQQFDPNVKAAGQVEIHLHSGGLLSSPTMQGQLQVKNAEFTTASLPVGVDNLNAQINLSGNRADIANFSGTVGGGNVSARGFATIGHGSAFNLGLNADSVRILYPEGLRSVLTAQLNFRGNTTSSFLAGRVQVDNLEFTQQFDLASFAGTFSETSTGGPPSPFEKGVKLNIKVSSLQQINLASNKLSIGGSANLNVVGTMAQPVILGRISLTSGEVFFLGKRFEVQSGTIEFANPVRTAPVVRMFVTTRIEQYNITLNLSGPVDRLRTNYTSDPALPPADIIHLLAFGNTLEEASAQPSQSAAMGAQSILAQGVGSQVAGKLENLTGISQLTIDPLATSSSGHPGQQIAIQERVTGSLLFTFSTNVTTTQGQTVELQYDLNRRVSVTVLRDQNGGYGIDLRWHKVF